MPPLVTAARWSRFDLDQQILMIANAMSRAGKLLAAGDAGRRRSSYAEALDLADLTIQTRPDRGLRRELLRWRDLVAALYLDQIPEPAAHEAAFRALLQFTPTAFRQQAFR